MKYVNNLNKAILVLAAILVMVPGLIFGGGYLVVSDTGVPYKWAPGVPVPYNPDGGGLGTFTTNPAAVAYAAAAIEEWDTAHLPTSDLSFVNAGSLPIIPGFDGDVDTIGEFFMFYFVIDGLSPVIFDADGTLFDALFGPGTGVLGFATIEVITVGAPFHIVESFQAYNGRWIDGIAGNGEFPLANFAAVITHEMGHALNLDHTQVNGQFFIGDTDPGFGVYGPPPPGSAMMMFPFLFGPPLDALSPLSDDIAWISNLYPTAAFATTFASISGTVFEPDATTLLQGANVIARPLADPYLSAVSNVSGFLYFPGPGAPPPALEGAYKIPGLLPSASHTVEMTEVNPAFTGGSGVGPLDPPIDIPIEEFWNDTGEDATDPPDDPLVFVPVATGAPGTDVPGIDIIKNGTICVDPFEPNNVYTDAALILGGQCLDACLDPSSESDFYKFDITLAGEIIKADVLADALTPPSPVDPFLTLYDTDGTTILAADDDGGQFFDSQIVFSMPAPGTYFLEVTESPFGSVTGEYQMCLEIFPPFSCDDPDWGDDYTTAEPIGYGDSRDGCIDPAGDEDWFSFVAEEGDIILANVLADALFPPSLLDPNLTLYDSDGSTQLAFDDDSGQFFDSQMEFVMPHDGTYYMQVQGFLGFSTGEFRLTLEKTGQLPDLATCLYDQISTVTPAGNGFPSQEFAAADAAFNNEGADDFSVPAGVFWRVTTVVADGFSMTARPTNVDVIFYNDDGGLPGTVANAQTDIVPGSVGNGDLFAIDLPTPVDLRGGNTYWVAVVVDEDFATHGQWFWANTSDINGNEHAWRNPGDGFGTGCTDWDTGSNCGVGGASPGDPRDAMFAICGREIKQYVFLADKTIKIDGNEISEGDMHSNDDVWFGVGKDNPAIHTGNVRGRADVTIHGQNKIDGDVRAGDDLFLFGNATVTGTADKGTVPNVPLPSPAFSAGGPGITVPKKSAIALAPGSYGNVKVEKKGDLSLSSGDYFMNILDTDRWAKIIVDVSSGNPININVVRELEFDDRVNIEIIAPPGLGAEDVTDLVTFTSLQKHKIDIGKNCLILGTIIASDAEVHFSKGCAFKGAICADKITVEEEVPFRHHTKPGLPKRNFVPDDEDIEEIEVTSIVTEYELAQNYPNPFNPTTNIRFAMRETGHVTLSIYNSTGQLVRTLVSSEYAQGWHTITWDAKDDSGVQVASGVYLYSIKTNDFVAQRKLVLMK